MPRPTKLNADTQAAILKALSIGATYKDAAEAAGVAYETFRFWMEQGAAGKRPYSEFSALVRRTEADTRIKFLSVITNAAHEGEWRAALEYLKRRDRPTWGDNIDVTSGGEQINIALKWDDTGTDG